MDPSKPSRAAERREALLAAAVRLFAERGFESVTIHQIGKAVGVTEPIVYKHFPSKQALYHAIIERQVEQSRDLEEKFAALCEAPPPKPEEFLREVLPLVITWLQSDPHFTWLAVRSGMERHEASQMFRDYVRAAYFQRLERVLDQFVKSGTIRPVHAATATFVLTSVVRVYVLDSQVLNRQETVPQNVDQLIDILWDGLNPD